MGKTKKIIGLVMFLLIVNCFNVLGDDILINSKDWKDVYSGMQYGYTVGKQPKFLASDKHSTSILNEIKPDSKVEIFSSKKSPFVVGYESLVKGKGYDAQETKFNSLSLELAKKLGDEINNYIIVDDSYGYNAIAVAPYAIISNSFVLFADRNNINEIRSFLNKKNPDKILIYSTVDREVRDALEKFNPDIINNDGDRFANNVEIVKMYKEINDAKQVVLTNGEFIEGEIMSGSQPVLFIGVQNVPEKIKEYIKNSNIEVGVLIGNELVSTATTVRRQTGISTFVKFARSARNPTGGINQIEGLDIFRLPKYQLDLGIESITYNALTKQLEVTIKNKVEQAAYFKGTYTLTYGEDAEQTIGDIDAVFIDGEDVKTLVYDLEPIADEGEIYAKVFIVFGESKNSLERTLEGEIEVTRVSFTDDSKISIEKLVYDKVKKEFLVYIKNTGEKETFVNTEIIDINILDELETLGSEETIKIPVGSTKKSRIKAELSDEELEINQVIKVRAYYGEKENALVKIIEGEFDYKIQEFDLMLYLPILIIIILLILIIKKKKDKKKKE